MSPEHSRDAPSVDEVLGEPDLTVSPDHTEPIFLKSRFSRFLRWLSFGGFSSIAAVRPFAALMISAVDEPAEPTPMFSPAEDQDTPWALNRSPMPVSPWALVLQAAAFDHQLVVQGGRLRQLAVQDVRR